LNNYTSFLTCFHPGHTDVYVNGLQLAIIKPSNVELGKINPLTQGCLKSEFGNISELRIALNEALDKIEVELKKNE
jgi:hypothetical protein